jgi:hypothetical protein
MKRQLKPSAMWTVWRSVLFLSAFTVTVFPRIVHADPTGLPPEAAPVERLWDDTKATAAELYQWGPSTTPLTAASRATPWISQGPGPLLNGQVENIVPNNEVVGAIHTVAAHPTNPNILYAGAVNGGIWRTTNATAASSIWTPLTDSLPSLSIGALEFDPTDPNRLLAGIGRASSFARVGGLLTGLLLTNDGGDTWAQITHPLLLGENISGVALRGSLLLASSNAFFGVGGLFRSIDGGSNWTRVSGSNGLLNGAIFDLVGDPNEPNRFYASVQRLGLFRSNDSGATWVNISSGDATLNNVITQVGNNNTEMAVASNGRLYVAVLINGRPQYIGFTDDQGAVWTAMDLPQTPESNGDIEGLNPSGGGLGAGGQGIIHFSIRADPRQPHIVYAAGDRQDLPFPNFIGAIDFSGRLFRGDTTVPPTGQVPSPQWEHLTHRDNVAAIPGGGTASSSSPHADSREMVFDAAGDLIEVDDGGIYRRTNPQDNTGDWFSLNGNIQTTEFHDVAYDVISKIIIGGAQDTGTSEQITPGGSTWRSVSTADGGGVEVDNRSLTGMSIRYSSFQNLGGFRRRTYNSSNVLISQVFPALTVVGGGNQLVPQFYTPIKLNAINPARLIIGGANSVYESLNRGETITEIGRAITVNDSLGMEAIAYGGRREGIDNPDLLYVGSGARVFIRTAAPPAPLVQSATYPGGIVRDIALDPDDWLTTYVIDSNRVFLTNNGGTNWTEITGNLPDGDLRGIVFVPAATNSIFVGGRTGVFRMLTNIPGVWSRVGAGLPNALVFDLDYNGADDVLVAGLLGRGAWLLPNASQEVALQLVNDSVSFEPITATFKSSSDTTGCPSGFAGKFSFDAMLANISNRSLFSLVAQVAALTGDNLLQNANGGPGGVGSRLTIPKKNDFADGMLGPGEFVNVPFVICLKQIQPFEFSLDMFGVVDTGPVAFIR